MKSREESGFALLSVLLILILIGAMGTVASHWTQILHRDQLRQRGQRQAQAAAAGGMARARLELARNPDWMGGSFSLGRCEVRVVLVRDGRGAARPRVVADAFPAGPNGLRVRVVLPAP